MTHPLPPAPSTRRRQIRSLQHGWRRLQDHLMLNVYGGVSAEDMDRYQNQPDALAGLIALRTGRSRERVRARLAAALNPWRPA